jgi:hypothetical protein
MTSSYVNFNVFTNCDFGLCFVPVIPMSLEGDTIDGRRLLPLFPYHGFID